MCIRDSTDRYREGTKQRKKTERMVYWMAQTVVGKWCISDHAMRAVDVYKRQSLWWAMVWTTMRNTATCPMWVC